MKPTEKEEKERQKEFVLCKEIKKKTGRKNKKKI